MGAVAVGGAAAAVLVDTGLIPAISLYTFVPWASFFAVGILWSMCIHHVPLRWSWAAASLAAFLVLRTFNVFGVGGQVTGALVGLLPLSYLVMVVAFKAPAWLRRPMPFGDLSYGPYIWHMFVVHVVLEFGLGWSTYGVVPATLALAWLSWWCVERPALTLKHLVSRGTLRRVSASAQ